MASILIEAVNGCMAKLIVKEVALPATESAPIVKEIQHINLLKVSSHCVYNLPTSSLYEWMIVCDGEKFVFKGGLNELEDASNKLSKLIAIAIAPVSQGLGRFV